MSDMLTREDLEAQIISRALRDEDYRQRLITDPKTVIVEELSQIEGDISISDEIEAQIILFWNPQIHHTHKNCFSLS